MDPCRSLCRLGLGLIVIALGIVRADAGTDDQVPVATVVGAPKIKGAKFRFFTPDTGTAIGRLHVSSVDFEYRRQGFMRVAWRPLVVLNKVDLEIADQMVWSDQGAQIVQAIQSLGGKDELVLREIAIRLGGPSPLVIKAASGVLTTEGELELSDAQVETTDAENSSTRSGTFRLSFSGPHAGQLRQLRTRSGMNNRPMISSNDIPTHLTQ